jgi:hypothetical protein
MQKAHDHEGLLNFFDFERRDGACSVSPSTTEAIHDHRDLGRLKTEEIARPRGWAGKRHHTVFKASTLRAFSLQY